VRVQSDWSEHTPGWKFNEWELKGVPVRLEIGPRDVAAGQAVVVRRDTRRKEFVPLAELPARLEALLAEMQQNLFARALAFRQANTHTVDSFAEFKAIMEGQRGFIRAHWCGQTSCELAIKEQTGATLRCIPLNQTPEEGQCILCGEKSHERVLFARAY